MEPKVFLNNIISHITGIPITKGNRFGLELELEGRNVALHDIAVKGWCRQQDGSLRGESIEYTTRGSKLVKEVKKSVVDLFDKFKENGVKFNDSIRTSTHVHLNFSDKTVKQMINFFTLFTLLEEVLQYHSGEDRRGNLFCVTTREAEGIIGVLSSAVRQGTLKSFGADRYKYAACNLSTLFKFGTVEVRTMRGAVSAEQVNTWVDILNDMYEYALNTMKSPMSLITTLSHKGAAALMHEIFSPDSFQALMKTFPPVHTLHYSLMEGARIIQVFAYDFGDDFEAEVVPNLLKEEERLPRNLPDGRFYQIYRPDGRRWNCFNHRHDGDFWADGERLPDWPACFWSAARQRFVIVRDGELIAMNWARHHAIPDEHPPRFAELVVDGEEEIDEDGWDEPEPDFDREDD